VPLWTKCPIKVTNNYGGGRATVAIPDKTHSRQWSYTAHEFDRKYSDVLTSLKTEFVILFTTLVNNGEEWLANTFRNGVAIQYPFPEPAYASDKKQDPQVHVYPLIMLPWFQRKYRSEKPEKDPILFVDGKLVKWTKDVCFNCSQMLDRSLRQCSAVHESCTKPLVSEKELPTPDWIAAHATATDNIDNFTFKPIKDMAVVEPFEPFTIYALTTDEAKVKKLQEQRSDAASMAAQSRFVQDVACKQCLRKDHCGGFRRGGTWCSGLHIAEDYDYIHEKCEPWMAHVMLLTQSEPIDSKLIRAWTSARTAAYVLRPYVGMPSMDPSWYGKYKTDSRSVVLMRNCGDNPTAFVPYLHACKLLNVQPVSKWSELPPSYKTSKSLRAVAYGLASGRIRSTTSISSGWGSRSVEVVGVTFVAGKHATLVYDNNRRNYNGRYQISDNEAFYSDLLRMPGMSYEDGVAYTGTRLAENSIFKEAVIKRRFSVMIDEVKEACRKFKVTSTKLETHPPAVYEWLEERSKERCRQKRRSSKKPVTSTTGEQITTT